MPFDRRHVLAQWGGTLPGGEIWSNSLRLASTDTGPDADVPDHDEMVTWLTGPAKDARSRVSSRSLTRSRSPLRRRPSSRPWPTSRALTSRWACGCA